MYRTEEDTFFFSGSFILSSRHHCRLPACLLAMAATKSHASHLFDPYSDPAHPTNAWPAWRRHAMLATLAFQAFSANYAAGAFVSCA